MTTTWEPTPAILEKIKELASDNVLEADIAKAIGISSSTWYKKKKEHAEIGEALEEARLVKVSVARGKLWKMVDNEEHKNHFQAVQYYLNRYDPELKEGEIGATAPSLPSGFTWRIVTAEDVRLAKDGEDGDDDAV
jgi:hypothetical protein